MVLASLFANQAVDEGGNKTDKVIWRLSGKILVVWGLLSFLLLVWFFGGMIAYRVNNDGFGFEPDVFKWGKESYMDLDDHLN